MPVPDLGPKAGDGALMCRRWLARCGAGGLAALVALTPAACSGGEATRPQADSPPRSPTGRTQSPSVASPSPAERVLDAYLAMWQEYVAAARTPDRDIRKLSQHAAGDALAQLAGALADNRRQGEVTRGKPKFDPRVTSLKPSNDPKRAKVAGCLDDSEWLQYDAKSGELVNKTPGGKHRVRATVTRISGTWKVTTLNIGERGTC